MNPQELLMRIEQLEAQLNALKAAATIPYDIEQALRTRLKISSFIPIVTQTTKTADSEDATVDTGGGLSTEVVMKDPTGFLQVTIANTAYYIPYFSS